LERASKQDDATEWLKWFAVIALEAEAQTRALAEFLIAKTKLMDRMRGRINSRQEKSLLRLFREGPEGFKGGLSAGNYSTITGASPATTTRDLADLVEKGALLRSGERRHARYALNLVR
jgi:Fic family protein